MTGHGKLENAVLQLALDERYLGISRKVNGSTGLATSTLLLEISNVATAELTFLKLILFAALDG